MAEKERLDELYRQGFVHEEEESELASGAQQQGTPSSSPVLGESAPDDEADSESDEERENHEGQTAPAVKFHSALEFLEQVKRNFAQEHGVYEEFLGIMKDFKQQSVDTPGVVARVRKLFQGYPELLQGFSMFLPPGFRNDQEVHSTAPQTVALQQQLAVSPATVPVPQSEAEPNNLPEIEQARNYVRKVKSRFHDQPQIYKQFLEILHSYHTEHHSMADVHSSVVCLFAGHPDLVSGFADFLPGTLVQGQSGGVDDMQLC
eukprot:TRINITY_DN4688_c0_g1_i3.p1 TRINITY_DN4688_c0_g1~~TRINITY_DN4688_c0_g1_i3.p1  ORF type:complete len:261 (-),score=78.96 TRINITY_DN4688_c0_g1_i3:31-813(-)